MIILRDANNRQFLVAPSGDVHVVNRLASPVVLNRLRSQAWLTTTPLIGIGWIVF